MNNETPSNQSSVDILSESDIGYQIATTGQRFLNYLIDNIIMRYGISWLTGAALGVIIELVSPDFLEATVVQYSTAFILVAVMIYLMNYILYYTLCEKLFQGRTLGKLITGTKAVRLDGSPLTFKDALLRSLSRMVPFEVFSGFGTPWHDSWTNTTVIKTR